MPNYCKKVENEYVCSAKGHERKLCHHNDSTVFPDYCPYETGGYCESLDAQEETEEEE